MKYTSIFLVFSQYIKCVEIMTSVSVKSTVSVKYVSTYVHTRSSYCNSDSRKKFQLGVFLYNTKSHLPGQLAVASLDHLRIFRIGPNQSKVRIQIFLLVSKNLLTKAQSRGSSFRLPRLQIQCPGSPLFPEIKSRNSNQTS